MLSVLYSQDFFCLVKSYTFEYRHITNSIIHFNWQTIIIILEKIHFQATVAKVKLLI